MRCGVAVAADQRGARQGEALLRADDVDDAVTRVGEMKQLDAELGAIGDQRIDRSEEHTSELQSLMRISYAVFCLKKKIYTHKERRYQTARTELEETTLM